jgi:hypothetical protein
MAALFKSNEEDIILTLSGTACQWKGMGAAWERHRMCELSFIGQDLVTSETEQ